MITRQELGVILLKFICIALPVSLIGIVMTYKAIALNKPPVNVDIFYNTIGNIELVKISRRYEAGIVQEKRYECIVYIHAKNYYIANWDSITYYSKPTTIFTGECDQRIHGQVLHPDGQIESYSYSDFNI